MQQTQHAEQTQSNYRQPVTKCHSYQEDDFFENDVALMYARWFGKKIQKIVSPHSDLDSRISCNLRAEALDQLLLLVFRELSPVEF